MQGLLGSIPFVIVLAAGVCAPLAGWMAMRRARNIAIWFVYGALTGPIALFLLAAAPPGRCPACDHPVDGWAELCPVCGARFETLRTRLVAPPSLPTPADRPPAPWGSRRTDAPATGSTAPFPAAGAVVASADLPEPARVPARSPRRGTVRRRATDRVGALGSGGTPSGRAPADRPSSEVVLATAIYLSGNAGMEIGGLYAIARADDRVRIFGPVDTGQVAGRLEGLLADSEVAALEDRITIVVRRGRSSTSVVMQAAGGKRGAEFEEALAGSTATADPTSGTRP
ncbi:MAG: hypothetical protein OEX05_12675 [Chloroflexota bacterium]|nr:hypothetical protein [Chloroflexota bacterium]